MSTVAEIQEAIATLSAHERTELRHWLDAWEEDDWDRQITADAAAGKLDFMTKQAEQAEQAKRDGTLRPLPCKIQDHS
jgi:hypothetical protein